MTDRTAFRSVETGVAVIAAFRAADPGAVRLARAALRIRRHVFRRLTSCMDRPNCARASTRTRTRGRSPPAGPPTSGLSWPRGQSICDISGTPGSDPASGGTFMNRRALVLVLSFSFWAVVLATVSAARAVDQNPPAAAAPRQASGGWTIPATAAEEKSSADSQSRRDRERQEAVRRTSASAATAPKARATVPKAKPNTSRT